MTIRVSTEAGQRGTTIRIEGKLTGADLPDVRAACDSANPPLRLDLSGLKPADIDGIRALRSLSESGAELDGASPYIRQLLVQEYVRETVFYREALAMGLDRDDTIIRRRLAQKLEFLTHDLIVTVPPTEEELRAYFAEHATRYQLPALTTFCRVFIDPDQRGAQAFEDAEEIGAELWALGPPTEGAERLGDPFMLQAYFPERSELEIAELFGTGFAQQVSHLDPGRWHGPVVSGYGLHLVYVESRSDAVPAEFATVGERVQQDWEAERRRLFNEEYYARLRVRYDVVIQDPKPSGDYAGLSENATR